MKVKVRNSRQPAWWETKGSTAEVLSVEFIDKALDLKLSLEGKKPTRYQLAQLLRNHRFNNKYGDTIEGETQFMFDEFSKGKTTIQWSD